MEAHSKTSEFVFYTPKEREFMRRKREIQNAPEEQPEPKKKEQDKPQLVKTAFYYT